MKIIPKPEGFDLRDKRSDKSNKGAEWFPVDALFDANEAISKADNKCTGVIIVWREVDSKGFGQTHFRYAGNSDMNGPALLVSGLGSFMGWDRAK